MTPGRPSPLRRVAASAAAVLLPAWAAGQAPAAVRPQAAPRLLRPAGAGAAPRPSPGERFYSRGYSLAGTAVEAVLQGDVHVKSTDMPCVGCHRRSGMGSAEGPLVVPSIVGERLFAPVTLGAPQIGPPRETGPGTRPAYTDETLLRAVRDGVDASGRALSPAMPRYAIGAADGKALVAYLRQLGEGAPPGVGEAIVHVATVVGPGVSAERRASMLDVMRAFVRAKNGGSRYEARRRTAGGWDMKSHYRSYRDWVLDEWELSGPPKGWPAQLEELYRRQPVFAIVGGIADGDWAPVHAFCARHRLPSLLPQVPAPPEESATTDGFYSLYFSRGVVLEAEALAQRLAPTARPGAIRQVARCGSAGAVAAAALARALPAAPAGACVPAGEPIAAERWRALAGEATALVAWLDAGDRAALDALAASPPASLTEIGLSSTLLGEAASALPPAVAERAVLAHPFVLPEEFDRHAARALLWMKANDLRPADRRVAVNALFAIVLASDALSMPRTIDSREYFVEVIEHMTGRAVSPTSYPSLAFDPSRRFGSSGVYLLRPPSAPGQPFGKVEEWFVPAR
ncbi:MAG: hypothetical protein U0599_13715 [Vicinamibacteria bacterium]